MTQLEPTPSGEPRARGLANEGPADRAPTVHGIGAANPPGKSARMLGGVFALCTFVSAFLLFQVQPLISKAILPWFGGGPGVWTTAMLFFQLVLLGGYLYAHLLCVRL